jgi:hypothetical protein
MQTYKLQKKVRADQSMQWLFYGAASLILIDLSLFSDINYVVLCLIGITSTALAFKPSRRLLFVSASGAKKAYATVSASAFSLVFSTYWLVAQSDPAAAQFLNNAQTFFEESFGGAGGTGGVDTELFGLIFNALRGVFVVYLAISIIKVVAAARQDEDWQSLARTPMIILISITLGDVLAGLIIGNGTGG